jgi:aminopeptidase 2
MSSLDVEKESSAITFNTDDLELGNAYIYSDVLKTQQTPSSCVFDATAQRATMSFPVSLPTGSKAQLKIGFQGKLTGSMMSYYKSSWDHKGRPSVML